MTSRHQGSGEVERESISRPVIIFDGDDTLWETEPLYDIARSSSAAVVGEAGYDVDEFDRLQKSIDAQNVQTMGLSSERFPTSSVQAYVELATRSGRRSNPETLDAVYKASAAVFDSPAPLMPEARTVLAELARTFRLALLTKGDLEVQSRRIENSGLAKYFELIEVVPAKSSDTFASVLASLSADAATAWSIGNSLPSDILPAIDAGMNAIWIDAYVWIHEQRRSTEVDSRVHVADRLTDIFSILPVDVWLSRN